MTRVAAVLFDIDGTLITSGGAGAESWRRAFNELYGIPADIGAYTDTGMTDPEVGRLTFTRIVGHAPSEDETSRLLGKRLEYLATTVRESTGYRVLPGVTALLPRLRDAGVPLGLPPAFCSPPAGAARRVVLRWTPLSSGRPRLGLVW